MLTPEDIVSGKSYACKYKIKTMLDQFGRLPGLSDTPLKGVGTYEGFGIIKVRDIDQRLLKIVDQASGKELVIGFDDVYDIDEAEYVS
jgi:hypothetical protein